MRHRSRIWFMPTTRTVCHCSMWHEFTNVWLKQRRAAAYLFTIQVAQPVCILILKWLQGIESVCDLGFLNPALIKLKRVGSWEEGMAQTKRPNSFWKSQWAQAIVSYPILSHTQNEEKKLVPMRVRRAHSSFETTNARKEGNTRDLGSFLQTSWHCGSNSSLGVSQMSKNQIRDRSQKQSWESQTPNWSGKARGLTTPWTSEVQPSGNPGGKQIISQAPQIKCRTWPALKPLARRRR